MATSMFAELDANDDGVITEDEFWGVFRELPLDRIQYARVGVCVSGRLTAALFLFNFQCHF